MKIMQHLPNLNYHKKDKIGVLTHSYLMAFGGHFSYLHTRNRHFTLVGMKWSIPFQPEWNSSFCPE